ncbi:hypothetical protein ACQKGI_21675 [Peribacillus muralis]|uniref:hypothetical protein n=1 Tax=Peribacillus muralis TaxID=264697 RepID=UPI003815F7C2
MEIQKTVEIAFPFVIYKDSYSNPSIDKKEPIIHINTLAQIIYRTCSQESSIPDFLILVLDEYAIEGVGEVGLFEIDFKNNYMKKIDGIQKNFLDDFNKDFRLGIVHEIQNKNHLFKKMENLKNTIHLHGELKDVLQNKVINSKEITIQWIKKERPSI